MACRRPHWSVSAVGEARRQNVEQCDRNHTTHGGSWQGILGDVCESKRLKHPYVLLAVKQNLYNLPLKQESTQIRCVRLYPLWNFETPQQGLIVLGYTSPKPNCCICREERSLMFLLESEEFPFWNLQTCVRVNFQGQGWHGRVPGPHRGSPGAGSEPCGPGRSQRSLLLCGFRPPQPSTTFAQGER